MNRFGNILNNYVLQGWEIIFGDDDDEDETESLEKIDFYAEEVVPRFTDTQFKQHFRMNPDTFANFLGKLHMVSNHEVGKGHPEINLEKQALITIWYLSNLESFRSVADRFGVSKSTCWDVLRRICDKLLVINQQNHIIFWSSQQRAVETMAAFQRKNGFPGVLGCIDGSHVRILPPHNHPNSYVNRKKFHSVLLQGVCDHRKLFIDVYAGEPGSIHDARLFEKSDLSKAVNDGLVEFPNDGHLVGDLAYRLTSNMLVGFKNNGALNERQQNFNKKLSEIRVTIENAFAWLKGRFRRLKFIETVRLDLVCVLIVSACILHNICILNGDNPEDIINFGEELQEEQQLNARMNDINLQIGDNQVAIRKRNNIMNALRLV